MIADGDPFVVRHQRIRRPKQLPDIQRMVNARVEIGVVANLGGQMQRGGGSIHEQLRPRRRALRKQCTCLVPQRSTRLCTKP